MAQLVMGQSEAYENTIPEVNPSYRLLLGPGPCNVDPRVLRIASAPQLGHIDPEFFDILAETAQFLRWVFQTKNEMTAAWVSSAARSLKSPSERAQR